MISNVAVSVVAFLVALGILVSIHEFGHFWVARRVGVKVLRYSIGFGKPLWKRVGKVDDTEFVIAAIPLGGYVRMLDEREGVVPAHEQSRAFNRQPLWARAAVVIAGPLANFLLAIVAYWLVMMMGLSGVAPLIGDVRPDSPAFDAGFAYDDRIEAVNGRTTRTWTDARIALLEEAMGSSGNLRVDVSLPEGGQTVRELAFDGASLLKADGDLVANLGFEPWWPRVEAVIGEVVADSAAERDGLLAGDKVVSIDGNAIQWWRDLVVAVQPAGGQSLQMVIERNGQTLERVVTPDSIDVNGQSRGRLGVIETQARELVENARTKVSYPPGAAFVKAVKQTVDMSVLTVRMLFKLVTGQASLDNISGPVSIAQVAGQSASVGADHYINFIALISISLAVLNLLPIPMLDGGHLVYFAAEAVMGRAPSERVQIIGQQIGMVLLGGLMFLAFYNDLWRLMQ